MLQLISLLVLFLVGISNCELFSATEELRLLASNHEFLVKELKSLIENIEEDLIYTKWKLRFLEKEQESIIRDTDSYIANPLNAFSLIKQFTNDSLSIKEKLQKSIDRFSLETFKISPSKEDLVGAVEGIDRLQVTYNLKTTDFVAGVIDGDKYNVSLGTHDIFVIAKELLSSNKFHRSIEYFNEALKKIEEPIEFVEVSEAEILSSLADAYQGNGSYAKAIETIEKALNLKPENIQELIEKKRDLQLKVKEGKIEFPKPLNESFEVRVTRKVCSGDVRLNAQYLSKLHCRYQSKSAFSKIGPYKVEEAHLDPLIVMFHDIISDKEIEFLKELATAKLKKSVVFQNGEQIVVKDIRISEVAWFEDSSFEIINRITRRIEDITGLSMKSAENLQIQKYGIAGFYKSHYDFIGDGTFLNGDRTATFLIYMSDVEKGGATVFPYLKAKIPPVKRAATFWYNLFPSGSPDYRTRHSGCPIIVGGKWVANKWIHEYNQEWRRPCETKFSNNTELIVINNFKRLFGNFD